MEYFPDTEPPNPPSNLRIINVTANSVELEWDIPTGRKAYSEMEIKGYKLYYQLKGDGLKEVPDIITNTKYEIVGLENFIRGTNKTFKFYLRAIDRMYNYSEPSDELEVTLP